MNKINFFYNLMYTRKTNVLDLIKKSQLVPLLRERITFTQFSWVKLVVIIF